MIKLIRGICPAELTDEVKTFLTKSFMENKEKDAWNSPKLKKSLKKALVDMSHDNCAYCECKLGIESKDITIDHFKPKGQNKDLVVEWSNLLPACLRCNREKSNNEDRILNPCEDEPKRYFAVTRNQRFYQLSKDIFKKQNVWVHKHMQIEKEIQKAALQLG